MKKVLIALMVLALAVPVFAGENPRARAFISFDPSCETGPYVHQTDICSGFVDIYLVVDCLDGGVRLVSVLWQTSGFGSPMMPDYTVFHATAQGAGGPDNTVIGWAISAPDCVYPNECGIVVIVRQQYYAAAPGTVDILPNPVDGKMIVDCNFDADVYCVLSNGGICMAPNPGDPDCDCAPTAVEDATWGSIKALYQ
jgi:hypothetical protein